MLPEAPTVREIVDRSGWLRSFAQARIAAAVAVLGECTFAIVDSALDRPIFLIRMRIAHGVFAAGVLVFLQVKRRTLSLGAVVASTLLVLLPLLPIFWVAESEAVATGRPWRPFVGHRLILLPPPPPLPAPLFAPPLLPPPFAP